MSLQCLGVGGQRARLPSSRSLPELLEAWGHALGISFLFPNATAC